MEEKVIHSDPEIMGGTPVFMGTRVPASYLFEYLRAGESIDEFLEQYPSVSRKIALAALKIAEQLITNDAHPA